MIATALWILGSALAAVLALAAAVLLTPVKLGLKARTSQGWRLEVAVRLFGGLTPPIPVHDSTRARAAREPQKPRTKKKRMAAFRPSLARLVRAAAAAPRLVAGLLRPVRLERLTVDADIGLPDPADTGRLLGLIAATTHSRRPASSLSIVVRPDFSGPRADGEIEAVLSFVPAAFVPPGVRFAWHVFGARR